VQPHWLPDLQHGAPPSNVPVQEGHPEATHLHAPVEHDRPPRHAKVDPQPPQLLRSVSSFTQVPLQAV
jgi:hypothetical protein